MKVQHFAAHPWHGVSPGEGAPDVVTAYIEIVPTDVVKYEVDKETGILRVDRPQRFSNYCPTLYGFIPRTYCGQTVARRCEDRTGKTGIRGDGDPLDICVLSERNVQHGNVLLRARPVGGFRMVDGNEADDKIIAVLDSDFVYGELGELSGCPPALIERLAHYFLTYKQRPGGSAQPVEIAERYGRDEALEVIRRSLQDYKTLVAERPLG